MVVGRAAVEDVELMAADGSSTFVTGAYGMLGAWLVRALLERGERVVVLRRDRAVGSALDDVEHRCHVVHGDVADEALMARVVAEEEVGTVFHLAAQTIVGAANQSPASTFTTNIKGTWAVLEAARLGGARRVVVAASDKAYGEHATLPYTEDMALQPAYPYDVSKAATDLIARSYWHTFGLPVATTRFANIYGGGDLNPSRLIPELIAAALDGRAPRIRSDGTPERDFLYVEDAVSAYLAIADALDLPDAGARGEAFNAGGGRPVSVREVVDTLGRVAGRDLGAVYEEGRATPGEISRQYVSVEKIGRVCGWAPRVGLEEGLARTVEWYAARR
ncbi:MAG: NAD-dependent epimerase/dehydratase [Conexibacter sp.]|nr:NAD-dependent epimerase/dehydratase [Conexibacter sp.]